MGQIPAAAAVTPVARRSDAGLVQLGERDIAGLLLAGEMHGAPYDLLASGLGVADARLRAVVARWRKAALPDGLTAVLRPSRVPAQPRLARQWPSRGRAGG